MIPFVEAPDGTMWRKGDVLLAFVGVTHFGYFQISLDISGSLLGAMQSPQGSKDCHRNE